jgi:hypothetical protein
VLAKAMPDDFDIYGEDETNTNMKSSTEVGSSNSHMRTSDTNRPMRNVRRTSTIQSRSKARNRFKPWNRLVNQMSAINDLETMTRNNRTSNNMPQILLKARHKFLCRMDHQHQQMEVWA